MKDYFQACFTHINTGDLNAGWRITNISPNIRQSMISFFEKSEKVNEISVNKKNPDGSPLRIVKIICDTEQIALTHVQFGFFDDNNRPYFFSHGYINGDPYELLKDPWRLLGISDNNYHFSVEETENTTHDLSYDSEPNKSEILSKYGLNNEREFILFIKCVLFPLFLSTQTTVHIITDGTYQMAKELLYIIYHSIPYSLRPKITASTYAKPTGTNSMFVFSDNIPNLSNYVDPLSGKNNILNETYEKKSSKYDFILSYAKYILQSEEDIDKHYIALEKVLGNMGDVHINNMDSLRLAYITASNTSVTKDDINDVLLALLSLPVKANDDIINYIDYFMRAVINNNITLSDDILILLRTCIKKTNSEKLLDTYLTYEASVIMARREDYFTLLSDWRNEKDYYNRICTILRDSKTGRDLLNRYYLHLAKELVKEKTCTYDEMIRLLPECTDLICIDKIRGIFINKCCDIALERQSRRIPYTDVHDKCREAMAKIDPDDTKHEIKNNIVRDICDDYNHKFLSDFDEGRIEEYKKFYESHDSYKSSCDFLYIWTAVEENNFDEVIDYLSNNCSLSDYELDSKIMWHFKDKIIKHSINNNAAMLCIKIQFWVIVAQIENKQLFEVLIKYRVGVICDPNELATSLQSDDFWNDPQQLEEIYNGCKQYYAANKKYPPFPKEVLKLLQNKIKSFKTNNHSNSIIRKIKNIINSISAKRRIRKPNKHK